MAEVKHVRDAGYESNDSQKFVGRPSIWGNPFVIGLDGNRDEVIEKYEEYINKNKNLLKLLHTLKGKDLVCYCAPKKCHADILLQLANKE